MLRVDFAAVHGLVRPVEDGVGTLGGFGEGDAEAHGDVDGGVFDLDGADDLTLEAFGDQAGARFVLQLLADDHELVAGPAADGVHGPGGATQAAGDLGQELVADEVAVQVVDGLELVEVAEDHGDPAAGAIGPLERVLETVPDQGSVRKAREGVVGGVVGQTVLELHPVGHVVAGQHQTADGGVAEAVGDDDLEGPVRPVAVGEADQAPLGHATAGRQRGQQGPVVGVHQVADRPAGQGGGVAAQQAGDRRRDVGDGQVGVGDHDEVGEVLHDGAEVLLAAIAGQLGLGGDLQGAGPAPGQDQDERAEQDAQSDAGAEHEAGLPPAAAGEAVDVGHGDHERTALDGDRSGFAHVLVHGRQVQRGVTGRGRGAEQLIVDAEGHVQLGVDSRGQAGQLVARHEGQYPGPPARGGDHGEGAAFEIGVDVEHLGGQRVEQRRDAHHATAVRPQGVLQRRDRAQVVAGEDGGADAVAGLEGGDGGPAGAVEVDVLDSEVGHAGGPAVLLQVLDPVEGHLLDQRHGLQRRQFLGQGGGNGVLERLGVEVATEPGAGRVQDVTGVLQLLAHDLLGGRGVDVEVLPTLALQLAAPPEGDDGAEGDEDQRHPDGDRERSGPLGRARRPDPGGVGHVTQVTRSTTTRGCTHTVSVW